MCTFIQLYPFQTQTNEAMPNKNDLNWYYTNCDSHASAIHQHSVLRFSVARSMVKLKIESTIRRSKVIERNTDLVLNSTHTASRVSSPWKYHPSMVHCKARYDDAVNKASFPPVSLLTCLLCGGLLNFWKILLQCLLYFPQTSFYFSRTGFDLLKKIELELTAT